MGSDPSKLNVKGFLKSMGFQFGKKPRQLDVMFKSSLAPDDKKLFDSYALVPPEYRSIKEVLKLPKSAKQAARLFSSDIGRYIASMEFIDNVIKDCEPGKVVDVGCGAGFLIEFLSRKYKSFEFHGIDAQRNLVDVARSLTNKKIFHLNYVEEPSDHTYDYVICEFGWDFDDIAVGPPPHVLESIDGHEYCVGCSEAAETSFGDILRSWDNMLALNGMLVVTGRLRNAGDIKAFLSAANANGLVLSSSRWLHWKSLDGEEKAPALTMKRGKPVSESELIGQVAGIYRRRRA